LKSEGVRPHHVEGGQTLSWILMDYIDVVVHIFLPQNREFYNLESLWGEARQVPVDFDGDADLQSEGAPSGVSSTNYP